MSSQIFTVTVQAVLFSAVSTTLAQGLTMYQQQKFFIDPGSFVKFMILAICTTPPNYLYQKWLEDTFPARPTPPKKEKDDRKSIEEPSLSVSNTAAKFFLDQSFGAAANTIAFLTLAGFMAGKNASQVRLDIQNNFFPLLFAGWRVWPMVTLLNLVAVPFDYRMLVGNTAGVLWGVYMNLKTL